ncbi:MAG: hypothetical protein EP348_02890 [Alphaproteobacteria bacterium]|nr:MAG: hypothetical protein EP348_02890 [Alphaproteobacteria bacterium]
MSDKSIAAPDGDDTASNLRAIFEILSYIHVDAQRDNYAELADRIEFALNLAEKLIKSGNSGADMMSKTISQDTAQSGSDAAVPGTAPTQMPAS